MRRFSLRQNARSVNPGPRNCVGTWYVTEAAQSILDVSATLPYRLTAEAMDRQYNQIAVFDLQTREEIGTGSAGVELDHWPAEAERLPPLESRPELTTAHEMAHYLDDCGFGTPEGWASETEPRLEALRQAWENTASVRGLRRGLKTGKLTAVLPGGSRAEFPLMLEKRENCRYYLRGRELFARSFTQYLAEKSKNRVLLQQVRPCRESVEGRFYQAQWAEGDF